jgi:hypothetical protein
MQNPLPSLPSEKQGREGARASPAYPKGAGR